MSGKDRKMSGEPVSAAEPRGSMAPGKRTRSGTVQLRRHGAGPAAGAVTSVEPRTPPPDDDPFGMHLLGAVSGRGDAMDRLAVLERGVAERVAHARTVVRNGDEAALRADSAMLSTMLRSAGEIVRGLESDEDRDQASAALQRIGEQIEALWVAARRGGVSQASADLDAVFLAEDALFVAAGHEAPRRRTSFYGDRTAADMRGEARPADEAVEPETGSGLIEQFVDWFTQEVQDYREALRDVEAALRESVRPRDPSTVETLIASAAQTLIGMVPGRLLDAVAAAGWAWAQASRSGQAPAAGARVADPHIGYIEQDAIVAVTAFLKPHADAVLAKGPAQIEAAQISSAVSGPIANAFIERMSDQLADYRHAATARLGQLRSGLALVHPAGLQAMVEAMKNGAVGRVDRLRADVLMKWTAFVAEVTTGTDERGNVAHQGNLETVWEKPGTVQISMVVRKRGRGPDQRSVIEVGGVSLNGISDTAKQKLRDARRPLSTAAMHRELSVTFVDRESGKKISMGRIDVGPEQQIDIDEAHWVELAMLADGDAPDARIEQRGEDVMRWMESVSRERAEAGARFLLGQVTQTTEDIK